MITIKRVFFTLLILATTTQLLAKKVKFACDMSGIPIMTTGMHISGDFQTLAGFPGGDWNSGSTPLTQEPGTDIYSIVVDIPAFAKYEYKFVNGDQFYEAEFVPEFSRVGYYFNDNRWIYIDSTANDTTFVGAIVFGGNAPAGMRLVRFFVDMQNEQVSVNGAHVAGTFQNWDPASTILYSFGHDVYEVIAYMPDGTYEYKFYNGNTTGTGENVPGLCAVNGNREIIVTDDVLVDLVCYESCDPCVTGIAESSSAQQIQVYPNPAKDFARVKLFTSQYPGIVQLHDLNGRLVREYANVTDEIIDIPKGNLVSGVYFVSVKHNNETFAAGKLIFE